MYCNQVDVCSTSSLLLYQFPVYVVHVLLYNMAHKMLRRSKKPHPSCLETAIFIFMGNFIHDLCEWIKLTIYSNYIQFDKGK